MAAADIYRKTDAGQAEVRDRKLKLNPRLRTMLILVDGTRPELILREEAQKVGAPADFLQQLSSAGLIERASSAPAPAAAAATATRDEFTRFREAKQFMNTTIVDALGIKSFFFTMKLERAGVTADLRELLEPYRQAIAKAQGEAQAEVLARRVEEMLR